MSTVLHVVFYITKCVEFCGTRSQQNYYIFKYMVQEFERKWFLQKISPTNNSGQFNNESFLHVALSCLLEIKRLNGDGKKRTAQGMSTSITWEFSSTNTFISKFHLPLINISIFAISAITKRATRRMALHFALVLRTVTYIHK